MASNPEDDGRRDNAHTAPHNEETSEQTPLIAEGDREEEEDVEQSPDSPASTSLLRSIQDRSQKKSRWRRWPSLLALIVLCVAIVIILVAVFVAPQVVSEYANEAVVFEPTSLSIASFTATGVVAHVQGMFTMDASRVGSKPVRDLGRFGTWIAREVETKSTDVKVSFPEYGSPLVGTAEVPPIRVSIRNGHQTAVDFETTLRSGSKDAIRRVAEDWVKGKLGQLRVLGEADVSVRSGLITLPAQKVAQSIVFESGEIPEMPAFDILKLNVHEQDLPHEKRGLVADAAIKVVNDYPVDVEVPPLGFELLVPGCTPSDSNILLADADTINLHVLPRHDVVVNATGLIRRFPKEAVTACPGSHKSPLDVFLGGYLHGEESTVYVRGSTSPSGDTPKWIVDLMSDITVPVPFPGRSFGHLIKNFTMEHVHFDLPDFFAEPDSPESNPRISAEINALIGLPNEINFDIGVDRVRSNADVFYQREKFGELDLHKWHKASAEPVESSKNHSDLLVKADVKQAPLTITDSDVFTKVVQQMLTGNKGLILTINADVDVDMQTPIGNLVVRKIPAEGEIPVNAVGGHDFSSLAPKVGNLSIDETSPHSLTLGALVNFSNPTNYSASIPYADVKIAVNDTFIGHATIKDVSVVQGENSNVPVMAFWEPLKQGGKEGKAVGAELLSQYISGYNCTLTFHIHEGSIPAQPALGRALSNFSITLPMPNLSTPSDPADPDNPSDPTDPDEPKEKPHFIRSTIFHLISSTAIFTLASPFKHTTLYITHMNASAFYKDHPAGKIDYDGLLEVPPGISTTPRIPVEWDLGVGFDAIKKALGGKLKLDARADTRVRIGEFEEGLWYEGRGIGAGVRL